MKYTVCKISTLMYELCLANAFLINFFFVLSKFGFRYSSANACNKVFVFWVSFFFISQLACECRKNFHAKQTLVLPKMLFKFFMCWLMRFKMKIYVDFLLFLKLSTMQVNASFLCIFFASFCIKLRSSILSVNAVVCNLLHWRINPLNKTC